MSVRKFNAPIIYTQSFEKIDSENGILHDVVVCQEGEAKGHGVLLDKAFVSDVVKLGQEWGDLGVKSRFGHPNMCSEALGTYLGRFKNFRLIEGEEYKAIADLYLDDSAKITPNGNLYEYVLKLAETSPDKFGNSIVFERGETKLEKIETENGVEEIAYATIIKLWESDLVDSPAATDSLFSQFDSNELAYQMTTFLDSHPQIFELVESNPKIIEEFLNKYKNYKSIKMEKSEEIKKEFGIIKTMLESIKKAFTSEEVIEQTEQLAEMILCPVCNLEFDVEDVDADENGNVVCPHCGALVNKANPSEPVEQPAPVIDVPAPELAAKDEEIEQLKAENENLKQSFEEFSKEIVNFKEQLSKIESNGNPLKAENFQAPKKENSKLSFEEIMERKELNKKNK